LKFVRIKVIEASNTVLAPFDKSLQQEAVRQMQRKVDIADPNVRDLLPEQFELVELLLESSVKEVGEDAIYLNNGQNIPYGLVVWAAGNGPVPLTLDLIKQLGPDQAAQQDVARGRLAIDPWMRVISKKHLGTIFSLGDCSCIINPSQQQQRPLPATAQVASQQGEYLAKLFNKDYDFKPASVNGASVSSAADDTSLVPPPRKVDTTRATLSDAIAGFATAHPEYAKPFQFLNLGILAVSHCHLNFVFHSLPSSDRDVSHFYPSSFDGTVYWWIDGFGTGECGTQHAPRQIQRQTRQCCLAQRVLE
jgi:hypothetical protein